MGLFDIFKSKEDREREDLMGKIHRQIFPGGNDQLNKEVQEVRELLDFKYSREDVLKTYAHAAAIYFVADDKNEDRITTSILHNNDSVVTRDEAKQIYSYLKMKFSKRNRKVSMTLLAEKFNCSVINTKEHYLGSLIKRDLPIEGIEGAIKLWHDKRDEESKALMIPLEDTPAGILEEWTTEYYIDTFQNKEENEDEYKELQGHLNQWHELLEAEDISAYFKDLIRQFFIPYQIDPIKFMINKDATSDPYRYIMYQDKAQFSNTLQKFQEDPTLKAMGYPDWFYCAFPDVAMWAIKGEGNKVIKNEFAHLEEHELIDLNRRQLKDLHLKKIIDLYKSGHKLECALECNSSIDDDFPF